MRIRALAVCFLAFAWAVRASCAESVKLPSMELYPTPLAVGIEVACVDDDAKTATAEFVWRVKGEPKWHNGVDMTYDRAKRLIWGSIWPLEQGTAVEVKVSFKTDTSAKPQVLEGSATTRTLILEQGWQHVLRFPGRRRQKSRNEKQAIQDPAPCLRNRQSGRHCLCDDGDL